MRPPNVDSNAYSYHLKLLLKQQLVEKHIEKGYRLSPKGLSQVDRMSRSELHSRVQPKIVTMCVMYNEEGKVLLLAKNKQPFIGAWIFTHGKLHIEDGNARGAMIREIQERVAIEANDTLAHVADVYIYASINGEPVSAILSHIFTIHVAAKDIKRTDIVWAGGDELQNLQLAPGVKEIHALVENNKETFAFAEYSIDW